MGELVFHIAQADHWREAQDSGRYTWSTLDRTLADEGFIHCSEAHQWEGTLGRYYAAYDGDLVLLTIDTTRLTSPLVREVGNPVTGEEFPHVYGPIDVDAVVRATPLTSPSGR